MSPSLGEVGGEVSIKISSAESLMGAENFLGASGGVSFGDGNGSGFFIGGNVVGEDGSHEEVIIISRESLGIWDWGHTVHLDVFLFIIGGVRVFGHDLNELILVGKVSGFVGDVSGINEGEDSGGNKDVLEHLIFCKFGKVNIDNIIF
jgi:hypothetical protein